MVTEQIYVEYLISTPVSYTCINLAEHLENTSHDAIDDYLKRERHSARRLWELAEPLIENKEEAYFIIDDSVIEKPSSKKTELPSCQVQLIEGVSAIGTPLAGGKETVLAGIDAEVSRRKS